MGKRVLVAVNLEAMSQSSVSYAVQLASRINTSLVLVAVSPSNSPGRRKAAHVLPQDLDAAARVWLDHAVVESQNQQVGLEIFVTSGPFFDEVIRFVRSQAGVQFIVMDAPTETQSEDEGKFASSLKRLHQEFEGEILLVEKAGRITRVSEHYLKSSARGTLV
jgi:hypothetical protein